MIVRIVGFYHGMFIDRECRIVCAGDVMALVRLCVGFRGAIFRLHANQGGMMCRN